MGGCRRLRGRMIITRLRISSIGIIGRILMVVFIWIMLLLLFHIRMVKMVMNRRRGVLLLLLDMIIFGIIHSLFVFLLTTTTTTTGHAQLSDGNGSPEIGRERRKWLNGRLTRRCMLRKMMWMWVCHLLALS
uniref:Uncharacterized protein n=1 Tax=Lepeophtheirus salmonis TaxID=72036 RepID=A0A0K2U3V5_LEPSM